LEVQSVLLVVLIIAATAACIALVVVLLDVLKTSRSARQLMDDVDERLMPLLENAEVTVNAVNAELLRVDGIVTRFEEVSDTVSSATNVVREAANAPSIAASAIGTTLRRFMRGARAR